MFKSAPSLLSRGACAVTPQYFRVVELSAVWGGSTTHGKFLSKVPVPVPAAHGSLCPDLRLLSAAPRYSYSRSEEPGARRTEPRITGGLSCLLFPDSTCVNSHRWGPRTSALTFKIRVWTWAKEFIQFMFSCNLKTHTHSVLQLI